MFWYDYFKSCWENGTVSENELGIAVTKGWITEEQKTTILNS